MDRMKDLHISLVNLLVFYMKVKPNYLLDNAPDLEREIALTVLDSWKASDFANKFMCYLEDCDWLIEEAEQHMKQEALERKLDKQDMEREERQIEEAKQYEKLKKVGVVNKDLKIIVR